MLEATGSVLTNKYAEGYPGRRYYGGCEFVDVAERLAIERAKALFGAEHANVQPHSGTTANTAVYFAMLRPGDKLMGMDLASGGHLTHGHRLSYSGRDFQVVAYGVDRASETLDYDEIERLADAERPKLIICGASAYSRVIDFARFRAIADRVGALLMADIAHIAGLVAAGIHPSPVPHCHFVTTTTHKTLRGPRAGLILCQERFAKEIDRAVFPGLQGGPLMHVIAAKAVALKEAQSPEFAVYQRQIVANARRLAGAAGRPRPPHRLGRHRQPRLPGRRLPLRRHRQAGRGGARGLRHHRQQERHPLRPPAAAGGLRHPRRHPRRHHPRHGRAGDGRDRRPHRRGPRRAAEDEAVHARRPRAGCGTSATASRSTTRCPERGPDSEPQIVGGGTPKRARRRPRTAPTR